MTKVLAIYQMMNHTYNLIIKHIDYNRKSIMNLDFPQSQAFLSTFYKINRHTEIQLGDQFIVIRNGSKFNINNV